MPITQRAFSSSTQEHPARICCLCNTRQRQPNLESFLRPTGPPANQQPAIGSSPAPSADLGRSGLVFKTRRRSRGRRPPSTVPPWTATPDITASRAQPRTRPTTLPRARFRDEPAFQTTSGRRPLGTRSIRAAKPLLAWLLHRQSVGRADRPCRVSLSWPPLSQSPASNAPRSRRRSIALRDGSKSSRLDRRRFLWESAGGCG
jgi:hypothetical protein